MGPVANVEGVGPVANDCVTEIQLCKFSSQFPSRFEPII